ncbi:MAG TPA: carboxypeptidase-like regulatory domain-containing protein [Stenomitos sp.]
MRRIAIPMAILLVLLVGLLGCDLSPPLVPLDASPSPSATPAATATPGYVTSSPSPSPSPSPTPTTVRAIRGYVVDRNGQRLPGAKVAMGSVSVLTAVASASVVDEQGQTVSLQAGEFILLGVPSGDQTLSLSYDDASRSIPVTVQASGATQVAELYLPAYGAVPSGSKAVVATAALPYIKVQKASADASLTFTPESVTVAFKAPPNGMGDQIGAYSVTYYQDGGTALAPTLVRPCSVDVQPATSATKSGPTAIGEFYILDSSEALRSTWTPTNANGYLRLEFFSDTKRTRPILDRSGNPLYVEITCTLVP